MERLTQICAKIAAIIRDRSESSQLIGAEELLTELRQLGHPETEELLQEIHIETLLKQILDENPDLREIRDTNGIAYYHSIESLSDTYARILVWKSGDPLRMIAELVRESSRLYPRPVSLNSFREPPFGLEEEEIKECLSAIGCHNEYQDIAATTTSIGTQFLYSTNYLDADHALMLAEWLDVGQANNP
jgi:hypothetical protein